MQENQLMAGGDMSLAAVYSQAFALPDGHRGCAVQAVWTGSPVGTLVLQASLDGAHWSNIPGSDVAVNGAGDFVWLLNPVEVPSLRAVYTRTSGSGSLIVLGSSKYQRAG